MFHYDHVVALSEAYGKKMTLYDGDDDSKDDVVVVSLVQSFGGTYVKLHVRSSICQESFFRRRIFILIVIIISSHY